jgi:lipopolysaccharide transport system ATP-binding protein
LCTRVIVMRRGAVTYDGEPTDAIHHHRSETMPIMDWPEDERTVFRIRGVEILSSDDSAPGVVPSNGDATIHIHYRAVEPIPSPSFGVEIHSANGAHCFGTTTARGHAVGPVDGDGTVVLHLPRLTLLPGFYVVSVYVRGHGRADAYDERRKAYPFSVIGEARDTGTVALESRWELSNSLTTAGSGQRRRE